MKFTSFSCAIALLAFAFSARAATVTYTPGTGVLLYPENFFEANSNEIVQAISGAFPGTGSGNASTNAAQGWSASQTFNAPVFFGPTNAVTAVAGKQNADAQLDVVANLTSGNATNFLAGDGTFKQVNTNMIPGLVADILAAAASGSGGGGDVVGPSSSTAGNLAVFMGATGKILTNSPAISATNVQTITAAVAAFEPLNANKYQATNGPLTTLATLNGAALTNLNASSIASGTLSSNRLPAAVSFTTIDAGTLNATAVVGDASGLTGINATNITAGTLPDARLAATIARTNAPTLHSPTMLTPSLGVASATSLTLGATNVVTALAGKQDLDADLTALAAGTAIPTAITNAVSVGAPTLYAGTTNVASSLAGKAPLASPALTGDPTAPTASANDNDTSIATTAYVQAEETALKAANLWQATNSALTSLSAGTSAGLASALSDETGTGVAAFATAPTFTGATLNGSVVFGQSTLTAHSAVTNFVADPTVSTYQTINADLTTAFTGVRFLHATNVAAGRQTTVLVFAGTNAAVTVSLAAQFARNTNSVALTGGQILPISFYGYGSSPTNVIATMGTPYTR